MLLRKKKKSLKKNIEYQYAYTKHVLGPNATSCSASLHLIVKLII